MTIEKHYIDVMALDADSYEAWIKETNAINLGLVFSNAPDSGYLHSIATQMRIFFDKFATD